MEEEGKKIMQADLEYKHQMADLEVKRKRESMSLHQMLVKMRQEVRERKQADEAVSLKEDERIEAWVNRKQAQSQLKSEMERKWFL